jgi:hypothetical protein
MDRKLKRNPFMVRETARQYFSERDNITKHKTSLLFLGSGSVTLRYILDHTSRQKRPNVLTSCGIFRWTHYCYTRLQPPAYCFFFLSLLQNPMTGGKKRRGTKDADENVLRETEREAHSGCPERKWQRPTNVSWILTELLSQQSASGQPTAG